MIRSDCWSFKFSKKPMKILFKMSFACVIVVGLIGFVATLNAGPETREKLRADTNAAVEKTKEVAKDVAAESKELARKVSDQAKAVAKKTAEISKEVAAKTKEVAVEAYAKSKEKVKEAVR